MEKEDNLFSDKIANFQTLDMIQKIKKIKKKRKNPENMKKIEFPEILTNVPGTAKELEEEKKNININVTEGFERFTFTDDDYDGHDTILDDIEKVGSKDPRQYIVDLINYIYNTTVAYNKKIAHSMTVSLSNGDPKEGDEKVIYNHLCVFESIIFSSLVVNNWYYLMYYKKATGEGELFDFKVNTIKCLEDNSIINRFLKYVLLYFIEYALFFPEKLEYLIIDIIPNFTSTILNHTLCYIFLFFVIFYLSYNFASGFKNFLIDTIMVNPKNFIVVFMYISVVILYIIPEGKHCDIQTKGGLSFDNSSGQTGGNGSQNIINNTESNLQGGIPVVKDDIVNKANTPKQESNSKIKSSSSSPNDANSSITSKAATTVFNIIWNVIRFLIIISITVPLGGFFCLIYFVFYSIYAMLFYNDWDASKVADKFKQMMQFLDSDAAKIDLITKSKPNYSIYEMIVIKVNEYIEFLSDNFFIILFLFTFVFMMNDALKHVVNSAMMNTLFYLDLSFIFMVFMFLLIIIKSKFNINSISDAMNLMNNKGHEKNYDSSRNIFFFVNLLIYLFSLGGLGYFFMLFINFNKTK